MDHAKHMMKGMPPKKMAMKNVKAAPKKKKSKKR